MRFIQKYDRMNPSSNTKYEIVIEMMLCVAKIPWENSRESYVIPI